MAPTDKVRDSGQYTRRKAMKAAASVSTIALVAGCGAGQDGGDGTPTEGNQGTDGPGGKSDQAFRLSWARDAPIDETQINDFHQNGLHELVWVLNFEMGQYNLPTNEWINLDAEGWEVDESNNEIHLHIKDGVKWHQGGEIIDDFVGEDLAMQNRINRLLAPPEGEPTITGWDHDGKTLIYHLNEDGYNPEIIQSGFQRMSGHVYRENWRDLYERLEDATGDDELEDARQEVIQRSITLADDPPLSGPYMVTNVNPQRVSFERHEEHWSYEHSNWTNMDLVKISPEGNSDYQALQTDRTDFYAGIPETVSDPPEHVMEVYSEAGIGYANTLAINYGGEMDDFFGFEGAEPDPEENVAGEQQAKARQGIAWALDSRDILQNGVGGFGAESLNPVEKPFPTHPATVQREFPDLWDMVPDMLLEVDEQKAEEAFQDAGLTKEGGTWLKPNGEPLQVVLQSHPWSRDMMETISADLDNVGVNNEHSVTESSVLFSEQGGGTFKASQAWLDWAAVPVDATCQHYLVPDEGWPPNHSPYEWEVPPMGEYDADPSETWDVRDFTAPIQQANQYSDEERKESIKRLSWIWAYHLPAIPVHANPQGTGFNNSHFEFPDHPERSENGRVSVPGDGSEAAPVYSPTYEAWRLLRKNTAPPNDIQAKQ